MNPTRKNNYLYLSILIILVTTLMPGDGKIAGNQLDKVVHFLIFFFLGYSIYYRFTISKQIYLALFLGILLGWGTEFLQQYIPGRNFDWKDGVADNLGLVMGYFIFTLKR